MQAKWTLAIAVGLPFSAPPSAAQYPASSYEALGTTRHFTFLLREGAVPPDDLRAAMARAEEVFAAVSRYVGARRTPAGRLVVRFDGPGRGDDGRWRVPHVDAQGRIHLYTFDDPADHYLAPLAHELVHAFRRATGWRYDGFLEEGFASVVAGAVDEAAGRGFPLYGHDAAVAAGHLVAGDEYIPLAVLRRDHARLNARCQLQAYVPRAAFFAYLADAFGADAVVGLAYDEDRAPDPYRRAFGAGFDELVARWRADVLARYRAIPNADELARAYRASPIRHKPVCRSGVDY